MPTIGVAIAIPEPWATELQDYRTSIGDTTAAQIPTHITLLPPIELDAADIEPVSEHLVTVAEGISSCERLAPAVRTGPLDVDLHYPYHPHVTIAHHLDDATLDRAYGELQDFECSFDASAFNLYVHDDDEGWVPTHAFGLG